MGMDFEWDKAKAASNLRKHNVGFDEASTVFDDPLFITFLDEGHSIDEGRYITVGMSRQKRILLVVHSDIGGQIPYEF